MLTREERIARFLTRVDRQDGPCWIWTGPQYKGYAACSRNGIGHRYSYKLFVGPIPDGLELDHLCRVPLCVNPEHLEPVTRAENMRRRSAVLTACHRGHPFDEANTYYSPGGRQCRACNCIRSTNYKMRKKDGAA